MTRQELFEYYKANKLYEHILKDNAYELLKNLNVKVTRKMDKSQLQRLLLEQLTYDNFDLFLKYGYVGVSRYKAKEFLGVSEYKFKKLLADGKIEIVDRYYSAEFGRGQWCNSYDIESLFELVNSGTLQS